MYLFKILILVLIFLNRNVGSEPVEPRSHISKVNAGKVAKHEDWQFMAAIVYGKGVACSGVLIRPNWVITTATWVTGSTSKKWTKWFGKMNVRLGPADMPYVDAKTIAIDLTDLTDPQVEWAVGTYGKNDKLIGIEKIIIHDLFRPIDLNSATHGSHSHHFSHGLNNTALLKLSTADPLFKPIDFATHLFYNECKNARIECKAAGWFQAGHFGQINPLKETGKLGICSLMKSKVCLCSEDHNQMMKAFIKEIKVTNSSDVQLFGEDKLLAITDFPLSVYNKDSGGPLICENLETKKKILQGIILGPYLDRKTKKQLNVFADIGYFMDLGVKLGERTTGQTSTGGTTTGKNEKPTQNINKDRVIVGKLKAKEKSGSSTNRKNNIKLTFFLIFIKFLN